LEVIKKIIQEIDTDGSGFIEWKELTNFLNMFAKRQGQPQPSETQSNQLFKILDSNKDGKLSFEEISGFLNDILLIVMD